MIIQILSNICDKGYLNKKEESLISPFFSGSNVAFRRKFFEQIGLYDEKCATGEDQDISIRAINSKWELYFQPKAIVGHKCRETVKAFIKQWYRYGLHHPYIFKKHSSKSVTVYRRKKTVKRGILYKRILHKRGFPFYAVIFVSPFLIMNLALALTILTILLDINRSSFFLGAITFILGIYYFMPDIEIKHPWRTAKFIFLRYLANFALFIGGLRGGARLKMVYVSGTLDHVTRRSGNGII
jgi:cellulose synthase/poly-beta-1,6-N-acetylglucosamine synthase-like glycosyltransferase